MQTLRFVLTPQSAFGTPLAGDTLFGQLCWSLRNRSGDDWLAERLVDYTKNRPFLVMSDAFPQGFLPLAIVPGDYWTKDKNGSDRKALKKKRWLPLEKFASPFADWQNGAHDDTGVLEKHGITAEKAALQTLRVQPHNTINRNTSTTEEGMFAPYGMTQIWFHPKMRLDLYAVIDETRITAEALTAALKDMGQSGYGRDASIGLGKFTIEHDTAFTSLPHATDANAFLTLAPSAPQGLGFDAEKSFYHLFTRFGRHGDIAAHSGNPFKRPLLLAKTGSVFTPKDENVDGALYIGQGLKDVSLSHLQSVAQGYAPVIGIRVERSSK